MKSKNRGTICKIEKPLEKSLLEIQAPFTKVKVHRCTITVKAFGYKFGAYV